ncbi:MAG: DUF4214 domain-containing protein [Lachnospiraceae bacterium]|nr:DUF4214 domain-containing protein [Lachnospiraceae bacterium]
MSLLKKGKIRAVSAISSLLLVLTAAFAAPVTVSAKNEDTGSADLKVTYHTKREIAQYISQHPYDNAKLVNFDIMPNTSQPYALGKVSDSVLNDALTYVNIYRYIAGIPANVTLDAGYTEKAQAATIVNAANGRMSHKPEHPTGMSDELFGLGYTGAGSSNLGYNYSNLAHVISAGWMNDSDSGNRSMVGHRRWVLNPKMSKTGFGVSPGAKHTAMYVFDQNNSEGSNYYNVAWPAQNTPYDYFNSSYPWTISTGDAISAAKVTVKCVNDGKTWSFDTLGATNTGYFNYNNQGYGQKGCIIFIPSGIKTDKGYSYEVSALYTISGGITKQLNYTVDFFDINDYMYTDEQVKQVKAFVERFYNIILGRPSEEAGINDWTNKLLTKELTGAEVAAGFARSTEFTGQNTSNADFLKKYYKAFFDREPDADGYNDWLSLLNRGASRERILVGFTNSVEFQNLCDSFGINPGSLPDVNEPDPPAPTPKWDASNVDDAKLREYIDRLYIYTLGRPADEAGAASWMEVIKNGYDDWGTEYDAAKVAGVGFFTSEEYVQRERTNEEFLHDAYAAFFDREPDAPGMEHWLYNLNIGAYDRKRVIEEGFGDSIEFCELLESYGFVKIR